MVDTRRYQDDSGLYQISVNNLNDSSGPKRHTFSPVHLVFLPRVSGAATACFNCDALGAPLQEHMPDTQTLNALLPDLTSGPLRLCK